MTFQKSHFINGEWVAGSGDTFHSINPSTGHPIWHGHQATANEVGNAVTAARNAFLIWSNLSIDARIGIILAFGESLKKHTNILAQAISNENGKPLWEATTEVQTMIGKIAISIEAYMIRCPMNKREDILPGAELYTRHRPHGVLGVLGPFNFPGHLPNGHIIPALLAGNTIVFKPSEHTPLVAELTLKCWEEAKIPRGVINLIQGGGECGKLLAAHPDINGILFTGSWNVGKKLSMLYASTPYKILALEMGGNNALVVGKIKDVKAAAYSALLSAFMTTGQRCTCARRIILIKGAQSEEFLNSFIRMAKSLVIGPPTDSPEPFMGPLISAAAAQHVLAQYNALVKLGSKPLLEMKPLTLGPAFLSPGILDSTGVKNIPDEEIFGPLTQIYWVDSLDHAIDLANKTAYGLTAGLLSDDIREFDTFYNRSRAGVINWNAPTTGARSAAPFGGTGQSGNNRPSGYYAADYCVYPVASVQCQALTLPQKLTPGITT